MSLALGYNSNRKVKVTDMAGMAGGNFVTTHMPIVRRASVGGARQARRAPAAPAAPRPPAAPAPRAPAAPTAAAHGVWGTAAADLRAADGRVVARAGERVHLVYPMHALDDVGRVGMALLTCHPRTAQLAYEPVVVHDPEADDGVAQRVVDFALAA
jgi:hypothetical protein